jgi:hypothetical protein
MCRDIGHKVEVLDLHEVEHGVLPKLRSSRNSLSTLWRANDVGRKRNLGLVAAIRAGWKYMLFVDDDISAYEQGPTLDEDGLQTALNAMDTNPELRAIGWTVDDFPDNSVLGHARRLVDKSQQIFIGGGALLVRCDRDVPFFPDVYNEDWLFLIAMGHSAPDRGQCFAVAGRTRQVRYDEYSPLRTRSQEAGDILGEGLMNLLEDKGSAMWVTGTTTDYWRRALARRECLIVDICRLLDANPDLPNCLSARAALEVAQDVDKQIQPEALRDYVTDWKADLRTWRLCLKGLPDSRSS